MLLFLSTFVAINAKKRETEATDTLESELGVVLTKVNEKSTVSLPLVGWQRHDTGHVVVQKRVLLLQARHDQSIRVRGKISKKYVSFLTVKQVTDLGFTKQWGRRRGLSGSHYTTRRRVLLHNTGNVAYVAGSRCLIRERVFQKYYREAEAQELVSNWEEAGVAAAGGARCPFAIV